MTFHVPEQYRIIGGGPFASTKADGNNGQFFIPYKDLMGVKKMRGFTPVSVLVQASDGAGWEHVSVSLTLDRTPTWPEMNAVKATFWDREDCVVQYHPPEDQYINNHPYCLHLWRPIGKEILIPPWYLVGVK